MSTETVNQQIPAGTWAVDPVHSSIHFAITHNGVATFRSGFDELRGHPDRRRGPAARGHRRRRQHRHRRGAAQGPPPQPRNSSTPSKHPAAEVQLDRARASTTTAASGSPASSRSAAQTHEVEATGRFGQLGADLGGSERVGLSLETAVDRRELRPRLERRPAERRPGARVRGRDQRRARVRRGGRVTMRVLGISGSLRRDSLNSALLRAAAERLPAGVELVEFERLARDPALRRGRSKRPPRRTRCASCARRSATPTRSWSRRRSTTTRSPASSRTPSTGPRARPAQSALNGKPAAAIGASTGMFGAVWAQAETRKVLGALGGRVVESRTAGRARRQAPRRRPPGAGRREQSERLEELLRRADRLRRGGRGSSPGARRRLSGSQPL